MQYNELVIRQRLENKTDRLPYGFWNFTNCCLAVKIIIEEKYGIKPKDIPVENMKESINSRIIRDYVFISAIINKLNYDTKDLLMSLYDLTEDDWFLYNNIPALYELRVKGYRYPHRFSKYNKLKLIGMKCFMYALAKENKVLTRSNIESVARDCFVKLGWYFTQYGLNAESWVFAVNKNEFYTVSDMLCLCFPHSFKGWDFKMENLHDIEYIRYAINYEIHVRMEITREELAKVSNKLIYLSKLNKDIVNLNSIYIKNAKRAKGHITNLIEWEGPLYDKMKKELEYVKTHDIPFGYKNGDTKEYRLTL